ncbi:MAG: hypothetical protein ABS36_13695 [Acidobacteria bacterium SCN 69-37]|nr:MAG: hypothetical protein ABS36_13695 [Acidobacteria bacterium SCN 69-37]
MTLLRYAAFLGLAIWIGGLAVLAGIGAPTVFEALIARDPVAGRELAGLLFGTMLERFQYVAWGSAAVLFLSLGLRAAIGPRPRHTALRIWAVVLMLAISLVTVFVIIPAIDEIRGAIEGAVAALPAADPRRMAFGRWHGLSSGLMLLTIGLGLGLGWAEVHDPH